MGIEEIKKHSFFKDINWENVYYKKYKPEFVPKMKLKKEEYLLFFDKIFTDENPEDFLRQENIFESSSNNRYSDFTFINFNKHLLDLIN